MTEVSAQMMDVIAMLSVISQSELLHLGLFLVPPSNFHLSQKSGSNVAWVVTVGLNADCQQLN